MSRSTIRSRRGEFGIRFLRFPVSTLGSAVVLLIACRSISTQSPSADVHAINRSGAVEASLLVDPAAPQPRLGTDEEFVSPYLRSDNVAPEYPHDLLPANPAVHVVAVRVVFDEEGRVLTIGDSPLATSTDSEHASKFLAAVREAVTTWRCAPAMIRKFRDGPDNDHDGEADYRIMVDELRLKAFFDLSFSFEVVDGKPVVTQGT